MSDDEIHRMMDLLARYRGRPHVILARYRDPDGLDQDVVVAPDEWIPQGFRLHKMYVVILPGSGWPAGLDAAGLLRAARKGRRGAVLVMEAFKFDPEVN